MPGTVTIYHNPRCGTSRNVLALLREEGIAPEIVEYLKTPPDRPTLERLARDAGGAAAIFRDKEPLAKELGLGPSSPEPALLDAMAAHPILLNRPIVVTPKGTRLGRPVERVREIL